MRLECIVPPEQEFVSLAEVKEYLRIDDDNEDMLLQSLITAARLYCENYQKQAYGTQTLRLSLSGGEYGNVIELPRSKYLQSVEKLVAVLPDGSEKALAYDKQLGGDIYTSLTFAGNVPEDATLVVEYVVGSDVQVDDVKTAVKLLVANWYENRLATSDKAFSETPLCVKSLLNRGRVML